MGPKRPTADKSSHSLQAEAQDPMKRLLLLGTLLSSATAAAAQPTEFRCPGSTTVEMRDCASKSWEQSEVQLRQKLAKPMLQQWQEATKAVCASAYAPYQDGTIYPQLVVGCDDRLNRALLKEFKRLDD